MTKHHPKFNHSDAGNRPGEDMTGHPNKEPGSSRQYEVQDRKAKEFQQVVSSATQVQNDETAPANALQGIRERAALQ
jgi:hypothetical protein